ncbi:hydrogenase assembly chaperone hypC/hupF [Pyrolobus fumarii 1A]|uniref:Hydrogenase assembly chaperone hypC/hupF n=1 Tax=Pyrolobus fumarii (strain DSM 11204 / 1A) TaxID=694429 RepID=G0EGV6_PYRF1|nr:HypC/HybG/HupF family hydrogenase formation chaperone [Pyrolobus fumarii]AEM39254.1 hydrogenase assembly chaperone hypC/hupF [Pyrolobus fumarii 1A]
MGVPGRVVKILEEGLALVDFGGIQREVDVSFIPDVKPGDYVVVHAGVAVSRLDPQAAEEALQAWRRLLDEMDRLIEERLSEVESSARS